MASELEQRILDEPDDLGARSVYADWLQQQGDPRGTYAALAMGGDRLAALAFLETHRAQVLGPGAALLEHGRIAWRGGFVDEVRVSMSHWPSGILAHPAFRFVRLVELVPYVPWKHVFEELHAAKLPLLEALVTKEPRQLDELAGLGIKKLGVRAHRFIAGVLPGVDEVWVMGHAAQAWLGSGGCPDARVVHSLPGTRTRYGTEVLERLVASGYARDALRMYPDAGEALYRGVTVAKPSADERRRALAVAVTFGVDAVWRELARTHLEAGELVDAEIAAHEAARRVPA